jgi:multidrug efflux system membrane fusion protein
MLPRSVVTLSGRGDLGIRILRPDDTVGFVPIDLIDDTPRGLVLGSVPEDARVIVAGQDLVSEGEKVRAVEADADMIRRMIGEAAGGVN